MADIITYETHDQPVGCMVCFFAGTLPRGQIGRPDGEWQEQRCPLCGGIMYVAEALPLLRGGVGEDLRPWYIHPYDAMEVYFSRVLKRGNRRMRGASQ